MNRVSIFLSLVFNSFFFFIRSYSIMMFTATVYVPQRKMYTALLNLQNLGAVLTFFRQGLDNFARVNITVKRIFKRPCQNNLEIKSTSPKESVTCF